MGNFTCALMCFVCRLSLLNNIKLACKEEKSYRAYFAHPVCTAIANYVNTPLDFLPAEAILLSMSKFLRNKNMIKNDRESYKADGIFQYNKFEIGIVDISGPFGNPNRSKFQFDFHKAMYGCMSIMWDIVNTYHYGTIQTFEELEIHFIHSKGKLQIKNTSSIITDNFHFLNNSDINAVMVYEIRRK